MKEKIGYIGQGWIGKHYADNSEARGFEVVRYSLEEPFVQNRDKIADCTIVFIAVPTPTKPTGFDFSILEETLSVPGKGAIVVIKSTLLPGLTEKFQEQHPELVLLHSPEFLREATAKQDTDNPARNIIGMAQDTPAHRAAARRVLDILPKAPFEQICLSKESEMIKYVSNTLPFTKIIFLNMIYDLCQKLGCDYGQIKLAMQNDPMISNHHLEPVHKTGRGAGGDCLIKDFAALRFFVEDNNLDEEYIALLKQFEKINKGLLRSTNKDLGLLEGVYGKE